MGILAIILLAIGAADLARPIDADARRGPLVRALIIGLGVSAVGWWGVGLAPWSLPVVLAATALWITSTPVRGRVWPLVGLAVVAVVLLAVDALLPAPAGWAAELYGSLARGPLARVPFEAALLGAGVVAFLADTSNIIVRMVLLATDRRAIGVAPALKGGRVLGPLERLFIFAMALGGQYLAITAVVAAKSIIRFPEISKDKHGAKAEYFLIGSFVSWSLGLVPVLLFLPTP